MCLWKKYATFMSAMLKKCFDYIFYIVHVNFPMCTTKQSFWVSGHLFCLLKKGKIRLIAPFLSTAKLRLGVWSLLFL